MALQAVQTLQQQPLMAPGVRLALKILRMPTLQLRQFLHQQLEENPLLELDECPVGEDPTVIESVEGEEPADTWDEGWGASWRDEDQRAGPDGHDAAQALLPELGASRPESLHDSLLRQLGCQPCSEETRRLGELLIHHLNEDGYLDTPLQELAADHQVPLDRLDAALRILQRLEPPGVAARDLRECLLIQLEPHGAHSRLASRILENHFELFLRHRIEALARVTGSAPEQVRTACEALQQLNPKPGRLFADEPVAGVVPDLIVCRRDGQDDVELNDEPIPPLGLSRTYARMLRDPATPDATRAFLLEHFRHAGWILKALEQRRVTLLAIGRCLLGLQRDAFERGRAALKPLTQSQVAARIGRHVSTVSRAIAGKTIATPCGIFRLEECFAGAVPQTTTHPSVSDAAIKSEIRDLIAEEDPRQPLSDAAMVRRLRRRQVSVARRTVAKYRAALGILPAHLRKRRV